MHKNLLLVCGALLCFAITACNKANVEPDNLNLTINSSLNTLAAPKNNIVILGGSTAWGKGATAVEYTWVYLLRNKLKSVNKSDTIINLAYPGYSTYDIMATDFVPSKTKRPRADSTRNITTALKKHPMLVVISLPSNDIANGYDDAEIIDNYKTIVKTLVSEKIPYILTSNQPRSFAEYSQRHRLRLFTDLLIKTFPGHVIDYLDKLGDITWQYKTMYNCGDGIHPNNRGHELIYNSFIAFEPFKKLMGIK